MESLDRVMLSSDNSVLPLLLRELFIGYDLNIIETSFFVVYTGCPEQVCFLQEKETVGLSSFIISLSFLLLFFFPFLL